MNTNPYKKEIEDLLNGNTHELVVSKDEFFTFREVWLSHPQKNEIVGEAYLEGKLVYRKTDK